MNLEDKYVYKECLEEIARYICDTVFVEEEQIESRDIFAIFREYKLPIEELAMNSAKGFELMAKAKKQWSNPFYTMYHFQNLNDFEAENESVQSFMDLVLSKGYSMRVQTIYKTVFYAEIVKDFETHSFAMIDGKGQLWKAKEIKGKNITIDYYIRDGRWEKVTESQYFEEE